MSQLTAIKSRIESATKSSDRVASSIFKLVVSECQRANKFDDEFVIKTISALVESNEVTLRMGGDNPKLVRENELLKLFLPKRLNLKDVEMVGYLIKGSIVSAKAEGQAIGVLAKEIKAKGFVADGCDIKAVVCAIRN